MDQPGTPTEPLEPGEPIADVTTAAPDATPPSRPAVPIRDSALGALGIAAPVLLRPAFLWLPTLLAVLLSVPGILLIPDAFFTGPLSGRQLTPAEARAFFDTIQQQMAPFVLVSLIETFVILPFVTVITYRLAFDFLDGRAPDPFGETFVATGLRVLFASIVVTAVFAGFFVAGGLIFALLVTSGAGVFLLLLLPILLVFASIVYLRLLPVSPLVVAGDGAIEGVQHAWSMSDGQVLRMFRWALVIALAAFAGGIAGEALTQFGALFLPDRLAYLLASLVQGPIQLVTAIMLTLLVRLLQHGPSGEVPVRRVGPDWGAPPPPV